MRRIKMYLQRTTITFKVICIMFFLSLASNALAADTARTPGQEPYTRAQSAWEKGDWETALSLCDESLKINRRYKDAWLLKGQIFWQMKSHKMAVSSFDEYLRIDPRNVIVWVNRGANLFELERYKEMQDSFEKALTLDPKCMPLYKNMGINYLLMGNYEDSHKAFQKLQELGETSTYFALTRRMLQITDPAQAPPKNWSVNLDSYQTVLELTDPSKAGYLVNINSTEGTAIRMGGSSEQPFKYAPNFEIWNGAMIFDKKGDGLLTSGTHYRYKKITGDTLTIEEGRIRNWRLDLSSKKCFLISQ
jgi:tetratricopeptide (TPR) repeat protein